MRILFIFLIFPAVFHDGQPITSADVAFSLLALSDNHPFKPLYAPIAELEPRRQLYAEFQRLLMRDMPVCTLGGAVLYTAFHRDLIGLEKSSWGTFAPYDELYWPISAGE